jgi:hypothetical protein
MNRRIKCRDGQIRDLKVVRQYTNGVLCYNTEKHDFHVAAIDEDVELDMDVTELVTHHKPWSYA